MKQSTCVYFLYQAHAVALESGHFPRHLTLLLVAVF